MISSAKSDTKCQALSAVCLGTMMLQQVDAGQARLPASLGPAQLHELALAKKITAFSFGSLVASQLRILCAGSSHILPHSPWSELWQRLLALAISATMFAWPRIAPQSFVKWRHWSQAVEKAIFFSFPLMRQHQGIQKSLDGGASTGPPAITYLKDAFRIAWGGSFVTLACLQRPPSINAHPDLDSTLQFPLCLQAVVHSWPH